MHHYLKYWYPYKINTNGCHWLYMKGIPFKDPFFDATIAGCKSHPINSSQFHSLSEIKLLEEWSAELDYIEPTAFIFHVSRCGSTLLSQLLGIDDKFISLAEVPVFDDILRLPFKESFEGQYDINQLFKSAIRFHGQKRSGNETHLFIKSDSWHILFWKQIRETYPNVPFILLYRRPDEVLRSNQKHRGMQAAPGIIEPEIFGFNQQDLASVNLDEYMAKVLERYFTTYMEVAATDSKCILINYNEGPVAMIEKTAAFSGIVLNEEIKHQISERSKFHSKYPEQVFSEEQENNAPPQYMQKAFDLYHFCEEIRMKQNMQLHL